MKRKKRAKVKPIELRDEWHEEVITLAFDAFRICIGMEPKKYSSEHIIDWIRGMPSNKKKK